MGNEKFVAHGVHFLFENRPLVEFQMGNEQFIAHGDNFFFGKRSLVL